MHNINFNSSGIIIDYIKYLLYNKYNYLSNTNNYDYEVHSKFIKYLLDLKKEKNINLFPFVNLMNFNSIKEPYLEYTQISSSQYRIAYSYKSKPVVMYDLGNEIFVNYRLPYIARNDIHKNEEKIDINTNALNNRFSKLVIHTQNMGTPIFVGLANVNGSLITDFDIIHTIGCTNLETQNVVDLSNYTCDVSGYIGGQIPNYLNKHILIQVPQSCTSIVIFGVLKEEDKIVGKNLLPSYIHRYNIPIKEFISDSYIETALIHSSILEYLLGLAVCPLMDDNTIFTSKQILQNRLNSQGNPISQFYNQINDKKNYIIPSCVYDDDIKQFITMYNTLNNIPFNLGYITHYNYKDILGY